MNVCEYEIAAESAVITMNNPPVNGLSHALRVDIKRGIDRANADRTVKGIILIGAGKGFSGGSDIREFNTPKHSDQPSLLTLIKLIEDSSKPVIAAISGVCMGGGFELALGCHFRIVNSEAQIAFPEVTLGIIPGAGGTQRLPRLIGVERALGMILSGEPVPAERLRDTALFDEIVYDGDLRARALAFVARIVAEERGLKRARDIAVEFPNSVEFFHSARTRAAAVANNLPAPLKCIEAVEASTTTEFDEGIAFERKLFVELINTPESRALQHAFLSEHASSRIPDVSADTPARPVNKLAVVGLGTMGRGIAMSLANAGIPVAVLDLKAEHLEKGLDSIRRNYENSIKNGRLTSANAERALALIKPEFEYGAISDSDLVIESVFENLSVKKEVFQTLDSVMKPGAILATNTSALDVNKIADFTKRPQDVIGMHFFSPANVMRLLEVVRGAKTDKSVLATVMTLAKQIKKVAVVSGVCDGFIGNRMFDRYRREAIFMLEEGSLPHQIDAALERFGMVMGPFRVADLAGNDISCNIRKRRYAEQPNFVYPRIADHICELGRFGQKTGAGWYRYEPGDRTARPDPVVAEVILDYSKRQSLRRRAISDNEIVERCILALVNEGARILEEGIALRASDIDVVYLTGYGFPRFRGGPMFYADHLGLKNVLHSMKRLAANLHGDPPFWEPAPSLVKLATEGWTFS
jgi:3-hydroxyacyl-CoA dehydrogenase